LFSQPYFVITISVSAPRCQTYQFQSEFSSGPAIAFSLSLGRGHLFLAVPLLFYLFVHKLSVSISAFVFFARFLTCFSCISFFRVFFSGFCYNFDGLHAENAEKLKNRKTSKVQNYKSHSNLLQEAGEI